MEGDRYRPYGSDVYNSETYGSDVTMLALTKIAETNTTITLGWSTPTGVGSYTLYSAGDVVSVASRNMKDGTPRTSAKFSKTSPGPPFQVAAVCRSSQGAFTVEVGTYPGSISQPIYPSTTLYPAEVAP